MLFKGAGFSNPKARRNVIENLIGKKVMLEMQYLYELRDGGSVVWLDLIIMGEKKMTTAMIRKNDGEIISGHITTDLILTLMYKEVHKWDQH